jgi:glycosyltransferase involved in cell wall biosynthesis
LTIQPLVSCVMPTKSRRAFVPAAIDCWRKQTYENRELIIVDDGEDAIEDLIPNDKRIRYVFQKVRRNTTGKKRNFCNDLARGEIICHFDDDDWSSPDRIAFQVGMLNKSGLPVTGFSKLLFWDCVKKRALFYRAHIKGYVCGTSLCYPKEFWKGHQFKDKQVASDNDFVYPILKQIAASSESRFMVARIHGRHTSSKKGITETASKDSIPLGFWENEELRLR